MSNYILRDVPPDIWNRFKARSEADQWHLRPLLLRLMEDYGRGLINPSGAPMASPPVGSLHLACPHGHKALVRFTKKDVLETGVPSDVPCYLCGDSIVIDGDEREHLISWAHTKNLESAEGT